MKMLLSVLFVLVMVSPMCAETVLFQEDFEEASAGNPGTALINAGAGWTGSAVPYLSNYSSVGAGNCLEWRTNGGSGWVSVVHAFSNTPSVGDTYTLTATLYVPNQQLANSSIWIADSAAEIYEVGFSIGQGYFDAFNYYPGGSTKIRGTATYNEVDVKVALTATEATYSYRATGTTEWTSMGSLATGYALSTYQAVAADVNAGFAGVIDSIKLTSSPVPEPSTCILMLGGMIGLLAYAWKKRR